MKHEQKGLADVVGLFILFGAIAVMIAGLEATKEPKEPEEKQTEISAAR